MHVRHFIIIAFLTSFFWMNQAFAVGHKITGTITHYDGTAVLLMMIYGGKQYSVDTAFVSNGSFSFGAAYNFQSGVYMVVLPPSKSFLILIDQDKLSFSFTADFNDIESNIRFEGSPDNTLYYEYLRFFQKKKAELDQIKSGYNAQNSESDRPELMAKMQQFKRDILTYQTELVAKNPGTLTAAMVKCDIPVDVPTYDGSPEEIQMKKYMFQKFHFFDNIDLVDERLIRAPKNVLVDKVDYYLDDLHSPDRGLYQ